MPQPCAFGVVGEGDAGSGKCPMTAVADCRHIWLFVYYGYNPLAAGKYIASPNNQHPFGGEKQNKTICEWLGFSVNRNVMIILTYSQQHRGNAGLAPTQT